MPSPSRRRPPQVPQQIDTQVTNQALPGAQNKVDRVSPSNNNQPKNGLSPTTPASSPTNGLSQSRGLRQQPIPDASKQQPSSVNPNQRRKLVGDGDHSLRRDSVFSNLSNRGISPKSPPNGLPLNGLPSPPPSSGKPRGAKPRPSTPPRSGNRSGSGGSGNTSGVESPSPTKRKSKHPPKLRRRPEVEASP